MNSKKRKATAGKTTTVEVAYICNGKNANCNKSPGCYYSTVSGRPGACLHTQDIHYAVHKRLDPKKNPERFDKFVIDGEEQKWIRYYEKTGGYKP